MTMHTINSDTPSGRGNTHRLDSLIASLCTAKSHEDLFQAVCALGRETAGAVGVAVLSRQQGSVRVVTASPTVSLEAGEAPLWLAELAKCYSQMLAENCQKAPLGSEPGGAYGVFVPLLNNEHGSLVLAAHILGGRKTRLESVVDTLQLVRASLFLAERVSQGVATPAPSQTTGESATEFTDIINTLDGVLTSNRLSEAASIACAEIAKVFDCRRVAIARVREKRVTIFALDQMESFSRGTRGVRMMEEAMQEALDQDRLILYSAEDDETQEAGIITRAARELASTANAHCILCLPLRLHEEVPFVMLCMLGENTFTPQRLNSLSLICRMCAPRLRDLDLAEEFPLKKAWRYCLMRSADIFGPHHTALKLASGFVGAFLFFSLVISGDIVVSAPLTVEGVHSYTHTAPMDSYLYEVLIRPGDPVKKGDILGRLDSTETNLEIAALEAQQLIHESQADQNMQEGKDAEAAIARLEADRTAANLAWSRKRLAMTELASSVDGFLVSEDMYPRLGQPVRRGQELFEVTDTASLRVVMQVDETDISDVNEAMASGAVRGEFTLTAYPVLHIPFWVERIHPYAVVSGTVNGFEVRGRIEEIPGSLVLRPGMEGHARITVGEEALLFLWTRKLVNKIRLALWRWF